MRAAHRALRVAVTDQMGVWVKRGAGSEVTGQDGWPWSMRVTVESQTTRPVVSMGKRPDRESFLLLHGDPLHLSRLLSCPGGLEVDLPPALAWGGGAVQGCDSPRTIPGPSPGSPAHGVAPPAHTVLPPWVPQNYKELELLRQVYYGGVEHEIRQDVWPFLLGHYKFGMSKKEMEQVRGRTGAQVGRARPGEPGEWRGASETSVSSQPERYRAAPPSSPPGPARVSGCPRRTAAEGGPVRPSPPRSRCGLSTGGHSGGSEVPAGVGGVEGLRGGGEAAGAGGSPGHTHQVLLGQQHRQPRAAPRPPRLHHQQ